MHDLFFCPCFCFFCFCFRFFISAFVVICCCTTTVCIKELGGWLHGEFHPESSFSPANRVEKVRTEWETFIKSEPTQKYYGSLWCFNIWNLLHVSINFSVVGEFFPCDYVGSLSPSNWAENSSPVSSNWDEIEVRAEILVMWSQDNFWRDFLGSQG